MAKYDNSNMDLLIVFDYLDYLTFLRVGLHLFIFSIPVKANFSALYVLFSEVYIFSSLIY